ncbi:dehydrogenase/oxidoreductase-like protein [Leishmania major strain Friedlin]|uniref:Dehydrogenase/oxidoreductase-like protein n=1 Tax=Leishmania major TaxID=5664 RepID=E9ACE7_LEIMA|nr:dehydrogenase/oxidoreductase-like protein [Leishmania major strain Friedlin]CBZ11963.1 dehydrogenase/oxidoreductase-like protein [Leishmania major strain Friedlin]|eukprot:XP_003721678.1 dehydrogenase/oxidoreductase-like protein [Leishmania major strain Friedlin]
MDALRDTAMQPACCASEDAVPLMCKSVALELIPSNIFVNVKRLGTGDTPMDEHLMLLTHQHPENLGEVLPIGRLQHPHVITEPVSFFDSDRTSCMLGADASIDGNSAVKSHVQAAHRNAKAAYRREGG